MIDKDRNKTLTGACLCGACTFSATPVAQTASICHCEMCRRWTGGLYMAVDCGASVSFDPGAPLGSYKGSAWGERRFCKTCGSSLVWQTQDGAHQHVSAQAFENPAQFELTSQVFIDCKPDNYALSNKTKNMTEAEVFAMFAPQPEANP
ncbi:MAG: GFA family protein [Albidovulum sp.]